MHTGSVLSPFLEEGINFEAKEERKGEGHRGEGWRRGESGQLTSVAPKRKPILIFNPNIFIGK